MYTNHVLGSRELTDPHTTHLGITETLLSWEIGVSDLKRVQSKKYSWTEKAARSEKAVRSKNITRSEKCVEYEK